MEALKTALEGSPLKTRDERCKVRISFKCSVLLLPWIRSGFLDGECWLGAVGELDRGAPGDDGDQGRRRHVQLPRSRVLRHPDEVRYTSPFLFSSPPFS